MPSALIQLDQSKLEESIGILLDCSNDKVLEAFSVLGDQLKNTGDNNKITQDLIEQCRVFQDNYNRYVESTEGSVKDLGEVVQLAEFHAKRANVGEVAKKDLSFQTSNIDASGALQG